jgi:hypothetical protein
VAFFGRPWAIENAETNAAVARAFANAATQNTQGINLPGDFRVTALPTPAAAVTIAGGSMTLVNKQQPGQSYIGTALEDTVYPIPTNSTGSTQHHLLIARVRDGDFFPWSKYTNPDQILYGPFFEPFVISGASSTVRNAYQLAAVNYTAEALALVSMPAGAQSVLPQYINADGIERRRLARPRNDTDGDVKAVTAYQAMLTTQTSWRDWPAEATWTQDVPYWATEALAEIEVNGIKADAAGDVDLRINFGGLTSGITAFDYNGNAGTSVGYVEVLARTAFAKFDVRTLAGGTYTLKMQGQRTPAFATANTGTVWVDQQQQVRMRVTYRERIV